MPASAATAWRGRRAKARRRNAPAHRHQTAGGMLEPLAHAVRHRLPHPQQPAPLPEERQAQAWRVSPARRRGAASSELAPRAQAAAAPRRPQNPSSGQSALPHGRSAPQSPRAAKQPHP
eukprot:6554035-Alexandrium_andersonii.AAC.1